MKKQTYDLEEKLLEYSVLAFFSILKNLRSGATSLFDVGRSTFDVGRSSFNMFDVHLSKQFRTA
ncbi:MAG: hypothetical protein JRE23_05225 [Deltaproteobacteria bacterium]|nr:hypothetical protein [Deltaproteobacteria bacterium]